MNVLVPSTFQNADVQNIKRTTIFIFHVGVERGHLLSDKYIKYKYLKISKFVYTH
jgi:hypothetical protein